MSSLFNARVTNFPPITGRTKHTINPSSRQLQIVLKGHMPVPLDISTLRFFGSCGDILCHCIATTHLLLGRARTAEIGRPGRQSSPFILRLTPRANYYYISARVLFRHQGSRSACQAERDHI